MSVNRIIPRLDIKGPNLVKGIHLEGLRVMGRPEEFARYYYEHGADELFFQDVVASLYERNSLDEIITKIAKEIFIPLTVGGGLRSIDDMNKVLRAGADKISINTAAIKSPELISKASRIFGSSTVVVAIEAIREPDGRYLAYTDNGRDYTGIDVIQWAKQVEELGAGEIILTSVDREGTGEGFDLDLTRKVSTAVGIPVIAHGGAGRPADIVNVLREGHADAIAIASIFHYDFLSRYTTEAASKYEGNTEFLKNKRQFHNYQTCSIINLKDHLMKNGLVCRPETTV